jgi:N-sulfoglucosamine sulfohydrolase
MNILLITADDLGYEAAGCLGCPVKDVTPQMDRFAAGAMRFEYAYVNMAICAPSRGVIATGRYCQNSGLYGFNKLTRDIPTTFGTFKAAGFLTGILGKVGHSTPDTKFEWDFEHDQNELGAGRSPRIYHQYCTEFLARCKKEGKPFYFMVNSHDPHRPFHDPAKPMKGCEEPSRIFKPEEICVPPYLPDLPGVRGEIAHYYNSVRRFDDTLGKVLQALDESGLADRTFVIMITDNGSAFPFAKANTYLASNRTPCIVRWPGVTKPGHVDRTNFVSEVDFFPTFMDVAGLPHPEGLDGRTLVPLLKSEAQPDRDVVFTEIDYKIGGPAVPMRCVQDAKYAYIFNAWSDGKLRYSNNNEGLTMKAMEAEGKSNPAVQARVDIFRYRVPQEFYDLEKDPGCLRNLIDDPAHRELAVKYQDRLRHWMVATHDHCLTAFEARNDKAKLTEAMASYVKLAGKDGKDEDEAGGGGTGRPDRRKRNK